MSFNLTTSGAIVDKAGSGVSNVVAGSEALLAKWSDQAEASIAAETRKDWVADFANVKTNLQGVLDDTASDLAAMRAIAYDMSGYFTIVEAQTLLDLLFDNSRRNLGVLSKEENKEKM